MTPELLQQIWDELNSPVVTPSGALNPLYGLLVKLITVIVVYFLARWLTGFAVRKMEQSKLDSRIVHTAGQVIFYGIIGVVVLWALGGLGLTMLLLLVVAGFALKDVIQNLAAALMISATSFTHEGDWVVINEFEGTVIAINWRGVVLETFDNRRVMIPNKDVAGNITVNYSRTHSLRRSIWVSVSPEADLARVRQIIGDALRAAPGVLADPAPQVLVAALYGTATSLEVRLWVAPPYDFLPQLLSDATQAIHEALREHDIALAVPMLMIAPPEPGRDAGYR